MINNVNIEEIYEKYNIIPPRNICIELEPYSDREGLRLLIETINNRRESIITRINWLIVTIIKSYNLTKNMNTVNLFIRFNSLLDGFKNLVDSTDDEHKLVEGLIILEQCLVKLDEVISRNHVTFIKDLYGK